MSAGHSAMNRIPWELTHPWHVALIQSGGAVVGGLLGVAAVWAGATFHMLPGGSAGVLAGGAIGIAGAVLGIAAANVLVARAPWQAQDVNAGAEIRP